MKKKTFALAIALIAICTCATGFAIAHRDKPTSESQVYVTPGWYYTCGEVITEDGNVWGYCQDIIDDAPSYDDQPVYVLMDNAGTPDNIYDDEIVKLTGR